MLYAIFVSVFPRSEVWWRVTRQMVTVNVTPAVSFDVSDFVEQPLAPPP